MINKIAVVMTKSGLVKKFNLGEVRVSSRGAKGVKGIGLREGDEVIGFQVIDSEESVEVEETEKEEPAE